MLAANAHAKSLGCRPASLVEKAAKPTSNCAYPQKIANNEISQTFLKIRSAKTVDQPESSLGLESSAPIDLFSTLPRKITADK